MLLQGLKVYGSLNKKTIPAAGGCRNNSGRHVSNRLKIIYSESWCRELSIGIYMSRIGGGGGPGGSNVFWTPPPKFTGPLLRNFKYIIGILSSNPVDWHPFWANWVKRGVCGHVKKSEAHALGCRPRGESSQWSSNSPQIYRIVPAWDSRWILKKRKQCGVVQASYGCLVGHVFMDVHISVFAP